MKPRNSWSGSVSRMMGFPWKKDFIGWKLLEARVAKNESVVHIADVFDEEMMVGKELSWLKLMDQICSLMETTMRQRAGESGLPIGLPLRCRMQHWPRAKLCISSAVVRRDGTSLMTIFRVTLGATFDDITWIAGFSWVNGKYLIVGHIHMWSKEIQKHEPRPNESFLVNAGEESSQVLIDQNQIGVDRR